MLLSGVTWGPPVLGLRMRPCPFEGCKEAPLGFGGGETPPTSRIDDWVASLPRGGEIARDEVLGRLGRRRRPISLIADVGRLKICSRLVPVVCLVAVLLGVGGGEIIVPVAGILVCVSCTRVSELETNDARCAFSAASRSAFCWRRILSTSERKKESNQ